VKAGCSVALGANVLQKFEQACSEIHLYELAVRPDCRRLGIDGEVLHVDIGVEARALEPG
jgi:ribosomal protein S18 acetylase RimI-like enzyme